METAIEAFQLTKVYPRRSGRASGTATSVPAAVTGVDLSVQSGELFGLIGPNGAGKTTLVKMLCTLIKPTSGTARVAGHTLAEGEAIRASVGLVVSDERSFYWRLSARQNLEFFAAMHGLYGKNAAGRTNNVLTQVELLDQAEKRVSDFSSGMRQRLAIARSLLHRPQILFLDEPSRSLDPTATRRLHGSLRQLAEREAMTIFLVTHDLLEAESLCQRVALMSQGRIRVAGSPDDLRREIGSRFRYAITTGKLTDVILAGLKSLVPDLQHELLDQHSRLRFQAAENDALLVRIIDYLRQQEITIRSIEGAPPTMEDVFAHYIGDAPEPYPAWGKESEELP